MADRGCGVTIGIIATYTPPTANQVYLTFAVINGATAGNVTLQWAPNTIGAGTDTVLS